MAVIKPNPMKKLILLLLCALPVAARAQQDSLPFRPGLLLDGRPFRTYAFYPAGERGEAPGQAVDLRKYCPSPGNQSKQASCVGFAIAYALTIRLACEEGKTRKNDSLWIEAHRFSPSFIFNRVKARPPRCDSGAYLDSALKWVQKNGVCLLSEFSYDSTDCNRQPEKGIRKKALENRLDTFEVVIAPGMTRDSILGRTMTALDRNNPVIVAIRLTPNFFGVGAPPGVWIPFPKGGGSEAHAMIVVGYDDREEGKGKIILFNSSFGSGWGAGGFVEMTFDDFARQAEYGVILVPGW